MSSSMPHLHAVHSMISSVVPVKLPVTRASPLTAAPLVWFGTLLIGRRSAIGRTCAAHAASVGKAAPGGRVEK